MQQSISKTITFRGPSESRVWLSSALAWLAWGDPSRPICSPPFRQRGNVLSREEIAGLSLQEWSKILALHRRAEAETMEAVTKAAHPLLRRLHELVPAGARWIAGTLGDSTCFEPAGIIPIEALLSGPAELVPEAIFAPGGPWVAFAPDARGLNVYGGITLDRAALLQGSRDGNTGGREGAADRTAVAGTRPHAVATATRNPRGPRPVKRDSVIAQMVKDYAGRTGELRREKQEVISTHYGVSRDTSEKARQEALAQLESRGAETPANSGRTPAIDK